MSNDTMSKNMPLKKIYIKTNGCQMNEYDSTKMGDVLGHSHGLEKTDKVEEADVILLNTCSIREKAQEKVFSQLGQWRDYKKNNPHVIIGVGGCVASQEGGDILKRAPFVDLVFGPQTLHRLPSMLKERLETRKVSRCDELEMGDLITIVSPLTAPPRILERIE